jgi:hypothetical protein
MTAVSNSTTWICHLYATDRHTKLLVLVIKGADLNV